MIVQHKAPTHVDNGREYNKNPDPALWCDVNASIESVEARGTREFLCCMRE